MLLCLGDWEINPPRGLAPLLYGEQSVQPLIWAGSGFAPPLPTKNMILAKNNLKSTGRDRGASLDPDPVLMEGQTARQASTV